MFQTLTAALMVALCGYPVLWRGGHGIGKSSILAALGKALRGNDSVIDLRLAQIGEGDLAQPRPGVDGTLSMRLLDFFAEAFNNPKVLICDEVDRALSEVVACIFQVCDSRRYAGHALHPETLLFAACNGGIGTSDYDVRALDKAFLDRWWTMDIGPSIDDFLSWAEGKNAFDAAMLPDSIRNADMQMLSRQPEGRKLPEFVTKFLKKHEALIDPPSKAPDVGTITPSRRSWGRLGHVVLAWGLDKAPAKNADLIQRIAEGFVGLEASMLLGDFARAQKEFDPTVILAGGEVPEYTVPEQTEAVKRILDIHRKAPLDVDAIKHFVRWLVRQANAEVMAWACGAAGVNTDDGIGAVAFYGAVNETPELAAIYARREGQEIEPAKAEGTAAAPKKRGRPRKTIGGAA